jgi:hypothetical protein
VLDIGEFFETFGKTFHLAALVFGQVALFENLGGGVIAFEAKVEVADRVFGLLIHCGVGIGGCFREAVQSRVEHLDASLRTGHDATQERQRGPVLDSFLSFASGIGNEKLAGEIEDVAEEIVVFAREIIRPLEGVAHGEVGVFVHPFFNVGAFPLDEVTGEVTALDVRCAGKIEEFEIGLEQAEQRLKFFGFAAVRSGRKHDQVLTLFGCYPADKMVTLLLRSGCSGRAGASVSFIDDHEFGALLDEDVATNV